MMQPRRQGQKQKKDSQTAIEIQQLHYEQKWVADEANREYKIWSRFNLVVASLGISILLFGVVSSVLGLTSIGYVGVASGAITSAVSVLVYRPKRDIMQRIDNMNEKFFQIQKIGYAMGILSTLHDEAYERGALTFIEKLIDVQPQDKEVSELPMERKSVEKTPQLPTNELTDTNT
jgi:hypothetical protein